MKEPEGSKVKAQRHICCKICLFKFCMKEYLDPLGDGTKVSIIKQINRAKVDLYTRHSDLELKVT